MSHILLYKYKFIFNLYFKLNYNNKLNISKFMIITGKYSNSHDLDKITDYTIANSKNDKGNFIAKHTWINDLDNNIIYDTLDKVRNSDDIYKVIKDKYPNHKIKNVTESDEIYFAVSPKDASGSDRSLVDCHYDAPFSILPNVNVIFYRVIVACNKNEHVTTMFPNADIKVKMNTGDFHGLDYNKDYHCVDGQIPENKHRVLLKLHYILVPNEYEDDSLSEMYIRFINVKWTYLSREFMRMSAHPNNMIESIMGFLVNFLRFYYNNISLLIIIIFIVYFKKFKF